jgi:hypothetical protein
MANESLTTLFKLKDALESAQNLAVAKADPTIGPILNKLSEADLAALGKISTGLQPLSFCNHAPH